jgi:alpha-galactosidase
VGVITRRELLRAAAFAPLLGARVGVPAFQAPAGLSLDSVKVATRPRAVGTDGRSVPGLAMDLSWTGGRCRASITNKSGRPVRIHEIVLVDLEHGLPPETALYGEGFQMLTQTGGTLGAPANLGNYTDPKHYRLPEPEGARVVYGLATFSENETAHHLLAFTSCRRFHGAIRVRPESLQLVIDCEGQTLDHRQTWELEEFSYAAGPSRDSLLDDLAKRLVASHPPLRFPAPPAGWCSWYCFGPRVTAQQVLDNLDVIAKQIPGLKYIQIDDGYQPAMGDWLETGAAFGGDVQSVLKQIRERGFEPAIWVAPFIAEAGSNLFKKHPDWFVRDHDGSPLRSDKVTFGGWRHGPWYALDGTHPEAERHLTQVFRTMREEWGCTYFKLDANFWGAIHGGRFHDPRATRIEAYRRGMQAVLKGTRDAFVLGCNHPIWPSMGLIHGSRSSHDIKRDWKRIADTARQNLMRNWQNGRLWWNDPDAIVLTGELPDNEFRFHATAIYATGGMILSGDDLTTISAPRLEMLRKLEPPTGIAATFADGGLQVGVVDLTDRLAFCLLNWGETPQTLTFTLRGAHHVRELWTNEDLGRRDGAVSVNVGARDGRVFVCRLTQAVDPFGQDRHRALA